MRTAVIALLALTLVRCSDEAGPTGWIPQNGTISGVITVTGAVDVNATGAITVAGGITVGTGYVNLAATGALQVNSAIAITTGNAPIGQPYTSQVMSGPWGLAVATGIASECIDQGWGTDCQIRLAAYLHLYAPRKEAPLRHRRQTAWH